MYAFTNWLGVSAALWKKPLFLDSVEYVAFILTLLVDRSVDCVLN